MPAPTALQGINPALQGMNANAAQVPGAPAPVSPMMQGYAAMGLNPAMVQQAQAILGGRSPQASFGAAPAMAGMAPQAAGLGGAAAPAGGPFSPAAIQSARALMAGRGMPLAGQRF